MTELDFKVNLREVAEKVGARAEELAQRVNDEVKNLSISTHAFVVNHANQKLEGWKRSHFFGEGGKNVRWNEVAPNIWVVEIDESVRWIEEGRDPTSMATSDWLLKPGAKGVKTAKDGSTYRVIPFTHASKTGSGKAQYDSPEVASIIKKQMREKGISLSKIDRDQFDKPRLGVVQKLGINKKRSRYPEGLFSAPRDKRVADQLNLKPHHGHHYLNNAVVVQREVQGKDGSTKISRDVVTFRVVSSKHQAEGRWMYPRVEPLNSIPEAYKYAESEWEKIVKSLEEQYRGG